MSKFILLTSLVLWALNAQGNSELRERALWNILGVSAPHGLEGDSRFQKELFQKTQHSTEPIRRFLETGQFGSLTAYGSKVSYLARVSLLLEMARGNNLARPFFYDYSNLSSLEQKAREIRADSRVQKNAHAILDEALRKFPKGDFTELRSRVFNPSTGSFEYLKLPPPEILKGRKESHALRKSKGVYVRPINKPTTVWKKIDGIDKKFQKIEVYVNGKWKEVLFPEISKTELAKWSPEKLGHKLSQKSFTYELPITVVSFALSVYLYERLYAVVDQNGPDRYNERFIDTITDGNVWAVAAGIYGGSKLAQYGARKLGDLRKVLKLEESRQLKNQMNSSTSVDKKGKRTLRRLGRAVFSGSGILALAGGLVGIEMLLDYRHYLKACSEWSNTELEMSNDERFQKLQICEEGYKAWGVNGKAQQFSPLILATAGYFALNSLGSSATRKLQQATLARGATLLSSADRYIWLSRQFGSRLFSSAMNMTLASHLGPLSHQTLRSAKFITPLREISGVIIRGVSVSLRAGAIAARMVVGVFTGPVGAILIAFTIIELTYDWWKGKIDTAVYVASVNKWNNNIKTLSQDLRKASEDGTFWEIPDRCESNQECEGTLVEAIEVYHKRSKTWREFLLRFTYRNYSEWIEYLSNFSEMYQATKSFYTDLIVQISHFKSHSSYQSYKSGANKNRPTIANSTSNLKINLRLNERPWASMPLYRSEPFRGLGGPANLVPEFFIPPNKRAEFHEELNSEIANALEDGRESDVIELRRTKNQIFSTIQRDEYFKNIRKLILEQRDFLQSEIQNETQKKIVHDVFSEFLFFAEQEGSLDLFTGTLNTFQNELIRRSPICSNLPSHILKLRKYYSVCIFHILAGKIGFPAPTDPGELYIRKHADIKLAIEGVRLDIKPGFTFGTPNVSLAEFLLKQAVCGPDISEFNKVVRTSGGWDLVFKPFSLIGPKGKHFKEAACGRKHVIGHIKFDPFSVLLINNHKFHDGIHFLTEYIDPKYTSMTEEDWWDQTFGAAEMSYLLSQIDETIEAYKEDVINDELIPALGSLDDEDTSFGNYIPHSLDFTEFEVGKVPDKVLSSARFEIQTYLREVVDPIVHDERHPLVSFALIDQMKLTPLNREEDDRSLKQRGKINLYQLLEEQLYEGISALTKGDHKDLTELKNRYVFVKSSIADFETFLNVSTDSERNALGANILSYDSGQFISITIMEVIKDICKDIYQSLLIIHAFDD